jgi:hypothetical protein
MQLTNEARESVAAYLEWLATHVRAEGLELERREEPTLYGGFSTEGLDFYRDFHVVAGEVHKVHLIYSILANDRAVAPGRPTYSAEPPTTTP